MQQISGLPHGEHVGSVIRRLSQGTEETATSNEAVTGDEDGAPVEDVEEEAAEVEAEAAAETAMSIEAVTGDDAAHADDVGEEEVEAEVEAAETEEEEEEAEVTAEAEDGRVVLEAEADAAGAEMKAAAAVMEAKMQAEAAAMEAEAVAAVAAMEAEAEAAEAEMEADAESAEGELEAELAEMEAEAARAEEAMDAEAEAAEMERVADAEAAEAELEVERAEMDADAERAEAEMEAGAQAAEAALEAELAVLKAEAAEVETADAEAALEEEEETVAVTAEEPKAPPSEVDTEAEPTWSDTGDEEAFELAVQGLDEELYADEVEPTLCHLPGVRSCTIDLANSSVLVIGIRGMLTAPGLVAALAGAGIAARASHRAVEAVERDVGGHVQVGFGDPTAVHAAFGAIDDQARDGAGDPTTRPEATTQPQPDTRSVAVALDTDGASTRHPPGTDGFLGSHDAHTLDAALDSIGSADAALDSIGSEDAALPATAGFLDDDDEEGAARSVGASHAQGGVAAFHAGADVPAKAVMVDVSLDLDAGEDQLDDALPNFAQEAAGPHTPLPAPPPRLPLGAQRVGDGPTAPAAAGDARVAGESTGANGAVSGVWGPGVAPVGRASADQNGEWSERVGERVADFAEEGIDRVARAVTAVLTVAGEGVDVLKVRAVLGVGNRGFSRGKARDASVTRIYYTLGHPLERERGWARLAVCTAASPPAFCCRSPLARFTPPVRLPVRHQVGLSSAGSVAETIERMPWRSLAAGVKSEAKSAVGEWMGILGWGGAPAPKPRQPPAPEPAQAGASGAPTVESEVAPRDDAD